MRASIIECNDEGQPMFVQGQIEHESPGVKRLMTKQTQASKFAQSPIMAFKKKAYLQTKQSTYQNIKEDKNAIGNTANKKKNSTG